ncbi:MAG: SDR family oxidoreductase, partial [Planctomycetota bacterium]|nr:SDR family oxidoreductase [Planctomycetota bacterium]
MGMFDGKVGLILGVANDHSIAWAIAQQIMAEGGKCGFTHLPDRPDDDRKRNQRRVQQLTDQYEQAAFLIPLDVQDDKNIQEVMQYTHENLGKIDFLLHSIAFADRDDLSRDTMYTSRNGFKLAMDVSVYSLLAVTRESAAIMKDGGSIVTMTYFGGEKAVPGYNVMGICKAALDATVRYLAFDLG